MTIRKIRRDDNAQVSALIRTILENMGVPKVGTAYADKALDDMYAAYQYPRSFFLVADVQGTIIGCGGIAPLQGGDRNICELQKMYVSPNARRQGIAAKVLEECLSGAKESDFKTCYLETMPYMEAAQKLYLKYGFEYLESPLGNTGHSACSVRMLKKFDHAAKGA